MRLLLIFSLVALLAGCHKDDHIPGILEIPTGSNYSFDSKEQLVKISIKSNTDWELQGENTWYEPNKSAGSGDDTLLLQVNANVAFRKRTATFLVKSQDISRTIQLTQLAATQEYHYQLPVIFHILYNDPSAPEQNISAQRIYTIIDECNTMYSNTTHSTDINLEFIPATHDPEGNLLSEAGIERIKWNSSIEMDCDEFMKDENNARYLWDLQKYINVFIYTFTNENVLGISYMPYCIKGNQLEGLPANSYYLTHPWDYPHCVSLNNQFILTEHSILKVPDATLTLTHELGHYLGLFHVFIADHETDYCNDTETYNRAEYEKWLNNLTPPLYFEQVVKRTSPEGTEFTSYNIMDYDFSYLYQFTSDQRTRIRYVLENSPFIPGPKIPVFQTRANPNEEKPVPILIK